MTSFTKHILESLKQPVLFHLEIHAKVFGCTSGVSNGDLAEAFRIMRRWASLVAEVIKAEFPHYHLVQAMQVFD